MTDAERNIKWIEKHCVIPEGKDVGKPVRLRDWQQDILRGIYDQPTRRAIISFGRKNAKTTLSAFLVLLHLCGPEAKKNSHLYSAAQSREQASILFNLAAKAVRMSPTLQNYVLVKESAKELICPALGTQYKALSAEASTAYGLSPVFIVHDELGQVKGPKSQLYEALETAVAAQENPLSIIISTQAPTDSDLLSVLIDDAIEEADPRVRLFLYTADPELDFWTEEAIRQANPAFGDFQNAKEVLAMANDARRMSSRESEFRNLVLNQRVERNDPFIARTDWVACGDPVEEFPRDLPVYGGLDLSSVTDLTALVLIGNMRRKWHVHPTFWLPGENIYEKAKLDRVPYDAWLKQKFIQTAPGKSVDYEYVAEYLRSVFDRYNIIKLGFDRKFMEFLKPWLLRAGFDEATLEAKFHPFGQGWVSMTPALRDLESEIVNHRLAHGNHPVLTMCAQNAVVKGEENARILTKKHKKARIDGMVALAMAMGVAPKQADEAEKTSYLVSSGMLTV